MKDYSLFFKKPAGFITKYEIENNEILVYTSKTKKGEPHRYPNTEKWRKYFEERLENQYTEVIEHQDEIIEYNRKRKSILYKALLGIFAGLYAISLIFTNGPTILGTIVAIASFTLTYGTVKLIAKAGENKFKTELKEYEKYLNERQNMEEKLTTDKNLTSYLSEKTQSIIEEQKRQKTNGQVKYVLDINFMDKTPIKDLNIMYTRYEISKSLEEEPVFRIPNDENNPSDAQFIPKKRKLKP